MRVRLRLAFFSSSLHDIANKYQDGLDGDDPDAGGFAAVATRRVAAATKIQFQTIATAASSKKRQKLDDLSSLANTTGGKIRRAATESVIGRRFASEVPYEREKEHANCFCFRGWGGLPRKEIYLRDTHLFCFVVAVLDAACIP